LYRNAAHNVLALVAPALLSFAATPFIVHRLGVEAFGLYVLTLSLAGFGGVFDLGLNTAAVKYVAEEYSHRDMRALSNVLNTLMTVRLVMGSLTACAGLLAAPYLAVQVLAVEPHLVRDAVVLIRVASTSVGLGMIVGTFASLPRAAHRFDITGRITLVSSVFLTLAAVCVVAAGRGIRELAITELAVTVLQTLVYSSICRGLFPGWRLRLSLDRSWLKKLAGLGGYAALGSATSLAFVHGTRIIVGRILGTAAVPYFSVPWSVSSRLTQVAYSMAEVMTPVASALTSTDATDRLRMVHRRVTTIVLLISLSVGLPLFLSAPDVLTLWMGPLFGERSGNVLRLLLLFAAVQSTAMVAYTVLTGMGRPAAANLPTVIGATTGLLLALLAGPVLGLVGIAGAVVVGAALQAVLLEWRVGMVLSRRSIAIPQLRRIALATSGAATIGVVAGQIMEGLWSRLILSAIVGLLVFHALLWMLGAYDSPEEIGNASDEKPRTSAGKLSV
jgi:O-antigen/teichoic acid export membrane protein